VETEIRGRGRGRGGGGRRKRRGGRRVVISGPTEIKFSY
jgi:hypothetical protein